MLVTELCGFVKMVLTLLKKSTELLFLRKSEFRRPLSPIRIPLTLLSASNHDSQWMKTIPLKKLQHEWLIIYIMIIVGIVQSLKYNESSFGFSTIIVGSPDFA